MCHIRSGGGADGDSGNNLRGFRDLNLKIRPCLSYVCHIRSGAGADGDVDAAGGSRH